MSKTVHARIYPDTALGIAQKNIEILSRHRKKLLDELYVETFGSESDDTVKEAYGQLDLAILRVINAESARSINYQSCP